MILLHGDNSWESFERYKSIKKLSAEKGYEIYIINGDEINSIDEITPHLQGNDLFGSRKVLFIKRLGSNRKTTVIKDFIEFLKKNASALSGNEIVFWEEKPVAKNLTFYKFFDKSKIEEFSTLKKYDLEKWTREEMAKRKVFIDPEDFHVFMNMTGYDQPTIIDELNKLQVLGKVTSDELKDFLSDNSKAIIWDFIDNFPRIILYGDPESRAKLFQMFNKLIKQGENDILLHTLLIRQVRILLRVKFMMNKYSDKEIISALRIPPFKIGDYKNQAANIQLEDLINLFEMLVEIESKMKTGQSENMVLELIGQRD